MCPSRLDRPLTPEHANMLGFTVLAALLAYGKLWVRDQLQPTGRELGPPRNKDRSRGPSALRGRGCPGKELWGPMRVQILLTRCVSDEPLARLATWLPYLQNRADDLTSQREDRAEAWRAPGPRSPWALRDRRACLSQRGHLSLGDSFLPRVGGLLPN